VDAVDAGGRGLVGNGDRNSSTRDSGWFLADEHRTGTCGRVFLVKSGFFVVHAARAPSHRSEPIISLVKHVRGVRPEVVEPRYKPPSFLFLDSQCIVCRM
jgi:hypothetical protein